MSDPLHRYTNIGKTEIFQNLIGKRLLGDIYWNPKIIGIVKYYLI